MSNDQAFLEARNVSKAFFGNQALRDVSIELIPGRIHALLGENGAGKSTLINLLSGALTPDSGEILVDGRAALRLRPAMLTGSASPWCSRSSASPPIFRSRRTSALAPIRADGGSSTMAGSRPLVAEVGGQLGLIESADTPVSRLPTGRRQVVEIAKALAIKPRVLILDEPTSSLAAPDVAMLTRLVRRLRDQRVAILYISHRLNEIIDFCDYVTVLKDGAVTADRPLAGLDPSGLVRLMVGRDPQNLFPHYASQSSRRSCPRGCAIFAAAAATGVDFRLRRGEILGDRRPRRSRAGRLHARALWRCARQSRSLPGPRPRRVGADRALRRCHGSERERRRLCAGGPSKGRAAVAPFHRLQPAAAPSLRATARSAGEARRRQELTESLARQLNIRGDRRRPVQALSGGNQQKVVVSKWLPLEPSVLLLNDPTRGVDVETKREIYVALRAMAAEGKAVVLLSTDTPELVHLCDRVMVFHKGGVAATLDHAEASEEAIVAAAMGLSDARAREGATV